MAEETTEPAVKEKKPVWRALVMLIVGIALMVAGGMSFFQDSQVNNSLVVAGAEQSAYGVMEMYPDSAAVLSASADVIDAAVKARTTSPEDLARMLDERLKEFTGVSMPVKAVIEAVMIQVNAAHKASDTEEKYLEKLSLVAEGIRKAVTEPAQAPDPDTVH